MTKEEFDKKVDLFTTSIDKELTKFNNKKIFKTIRFIPNIEVISTSNFIPIYNDDVDKEELLTLKIKNDCSACGNIFINNVANIVNFIEFSDPKHINDDFIIKIKKDINKTINEYESGNFDFNDTNSIKMAKIKYIIKHNLIK